jgi:cytochrome c oxidase subunit I
MKTKGLLSVFLVLLVISFLPDLIIWMQQRFVFGSNAFVIPVVLFIILLVSIPFIIKGYKLFIRQQITENSKEPVLLFAAGGLCWMIVYWKLGDATIDLHYRDTMYVISTFEVWKYISIAFGICCLVYFIFPVIFGRDLNFKLSRIHFWATFIGLNVLWGIRSAGNLAYDQTIYLNSFIFTVIILVLIAQLLFLFNIISSLVRKKEV